MAVKNDLKDDINLQNTAQQKRDKNDNPFDDDSQSTPGEVEQYPKGTVIANPVEEPTSVSHLIALIGGEVGFMVRSAKAHYGKFVPLPDMWFMLQPVAQKYGAFISIREGYDPKATGTGRMEKSETTRTSGPEVVKLTKNDSEKSTTVMDHAGLKTYEQVEESSTSFFGTMTSLTLTIIWKGEEYDIATKLFPTSTNAQEDGKMVTYHSRYLLMTRFAIAIVERDPDEDQPTSKQQATAAPKASSWKRG